MFALLFTMLATVAHADEFALHPSAPRLAHRAVTPDVASGRAHKYRTLLRDAARQGAHRDWLAFRLTSSLLYLYTCDEPSGGAKTFTTRSVYVWTGTALELLRTERLP
jgi:hypothetical protein